MSEAEAASAQRAAAPAVGGEPTGWLEGLAQRFALGRIKWIASLVPILFFVSWEYGWHFRGHVAVDREPLPFMILVVAVASLGSVIVFVQLHLLEKAHAVLRTKNHELARQTTSLEALYELGMRLSGLHRLETIEETAVLRAQQLFNADVAGLALVDEAERTVHWKLHDPASGSATRRLSTRLGECVGGDVVLSGEALVIEDLAGEAAGGPVARHLAVVGAPAAALTVPIRVGGRPVGALLVGHRTPRSYALEEIRLATGIANQLAVAINNSRLYERLAGFAAIEERERLAREMHDGLAQLLGSILARAAAAVATLHRGERAETEAHLARLREIAQDAYLEVRQGILGLRSKPDSEDGFAQALEAYVERFAAQSGIEVRLEVEAPEETLRGLQWTTAVQSIRIVQEALMNVAKHARTDRALVRLERERDELVVTVEDHGSGFDPARIAEGGTRFGLSTMRERAESVAGRLDIQSAPGAGTRILVRLPLAAPGERTA